MRSWLLAKKSNLKPQVGQTNSAHWSKSLGTIVHHHENSNLAYICGLLAANKTNSLQQKTWQQPLIQCKFNLIIIFFNWQLDLWGERKKKEFFQDKWRSIILSRGDCKEQTTITTVKMYFKKLDNNLFTEPTNSKIQQCICWFWVGWTKHASIFNLQNWEKFVHFCICALSIEF